MITRSMIRVAEIPTDDLPFTGMKRYRAGIQLYAEQMVHADATPETHDVAKLSVAAYVWNQVYAQLNLKIQLLGLYASQRRWAEIDQMVAEISRMMTESFEG